MNVSNMSAYAAQINLKLLNDIIIFVINAAKANYAQREELRTRCIFPLSPGQAAASAMQQEYGFLYLGELLERYEERFGMTLPDRRAIALALGYPTCLSYRDGAYCGCLLACFDSNKKVLYAEQNGEIVGRACIRLTKCCLTGAPKNRKEPAGGFTFVDLEVLNGSPEERHLGESLALFLERPYFSGLNPEEWLQVEALFIQLARQKAEALGAMLVLSLDYQEAAEEGFAQTYLHLYISASKAGGQYLDSLGGKAGVSSEGSYKKNTFLLDRSAALPERADETTCA